MDAAFCTAVRVTLAGIDDSHFHHVAEASVIHIVTVIWFAGPQDGLRDHTALLSGILDHLADRFLQSLRHQLNPHSGIAAVLVRGFF